MASIMIPDARDWIGALEAGQAAGQADHTSRATRRAGSLMTGGDYAGAARELMPVDMKTGLAVQQFGATQASEARKKGYGATLAGGKPDEAIKAAQAAGDFEIAGDLQKAIDAADDHAKKVAHEKASRIAEIVAPLGDLPENDMPARKAYIAQHRPDLLAAGYTDQQIDTFEPTNANLVPIFTQAMGLKDYLERTAPKVVGDALVKSSGEVVYQGTKFIPVPEGGKLVPVTGGRAGNPADIGGPATPHGSSDWLSGVSDAAPDAQVTSGLRTPQHNAAVGGVSDSKHLSGQAVDLVPRPGETMAQLYARVSKVPGVRAINEGDHVHVQAGSAPTPSAQAGDPPGTIYGAPKAKDEWVTLPAAEAAALGPGQYQRNSKTGEVKQVSGTAPRGSGAFKLAPQDSKYLSEARTAAQQLQNVVPLVNRFVQLNREVGTGGIMANGLMTAGVAAINPKVAEMKSITDKLTPAMRQGMPGAASDRDVAMFQSATVGLAKPGPANGAVARAIIAGAKRQGDYVAFLEQFAKSTGSLLGAQEEWDAYAAANPMFDQDASGSLTVRKTQPWRDYLDMPQGAKAPAAGPPASAKTAALKADPAAVSAAKAAIAKGAPRAAVIARLRDHGIDPAGI